jgi:hypothetical protein
MTGLASSKTLAATERQAVAVVLPNTLKTQAFTSASANFQLTHATTGLGAFSKNQAVLLQADQNCYVLPVATSAGTVSSATGWYLKQNEMYRFFMPVGCEYLAVIRASADGTLKMGVASP